MRQGVRNFSKRAEEFNLTSKVRILDNTAIKTPRHFERTGTKLQTNKQTNFYYICCVERFGKGLLAGASGAGLLALCYYGSGMSGEESAADRAMSVRKP